MMRFCLVFAIFLGALAAEPARADAYTVAYDTVQATEYRNLSNGFLGSRVTIGQVELNTPETNHVAFAGIRFTFHQADSGGAHATGVGAILYGRATNFSGGVATGVTNVEYWNANNFINNVIVSNAAATPKVFSQSFSLLTTNDVLDAYYNYYIDQRKVVIVSGGNNAGAIVDSPGSMANGITVWTSDAYGNPSGAALGPTWDGRAKPDLIAPRSAQVAASPAIAGNTTTFTNSSYTSIEGPSLSTPFVAGAAAILLDKAMGTPALSNATDPRVIKSILMTSAKKMSGWQKGTNGTADDATVPLDYRQGAGLLQIRSAYDLLAAGQQRTGAVSRLGWDWATISAGQSFSYEFSLTNALSNGSNFLISATLNWNVHPVTLTSNLFRNLTLALWQVTNGVNARLLDLSTGLLDNVQHVFVATAVTGDYRLVLGSLAGNPSGNESYALSWQVVEVPEPSAALLTVGAFAFLLMARRGRRAISSTEKTSRKTFL